MMHISYNNWFCWNS